MPNSSFDPLASRIREALVDVRGVTEKKMFGGIAFFVNTKMLVTANKGRMMVRIDPEEESSVLEKSGTRAVMMGGKRFKGFVHVEEEGTRTTKQLQWWIGRALEYNPKVKNSKSETRNSKRGKRKPKILNPKTGTRNKRKT